MNRESEVCGVMYGPATPHQLGTMCNYSQGHWGKHGRTEDGPEPVKPKRPVTLKLTESEAALVLVLAKGVSDEKSLRALALYQDGSGYEDQCALALAESKETAIIVKRLRKSLAKALDAVYGKDDE